jgi:plastocyanin
MDQNRQNATPFPPKDSPLSAFLPKTLKGWLRLGGAGIGLCALAVVVALILFPDQKKPAQQNSPVTTEVTRVEVGAGGFAPANVVIKIGQGLTWNNTDTQAHGVAAINGETLDALPGFGKVQLKPGESYDYTFKRAGTFVYIDTANPSLTGSVVVE